MPTYQYACTDCDHAFEQVQSFSDDSLTVCPRCEGRLRKIFNAVGVVFKGSGFYRTDSRSDAVASKNGSSSGDSATKSSDSADSSGGGSKEGSTSAASTSTTTPKKAEAGAA